MSDETEQNQGLREAHTPGENFPGANPDRAAKVGSTRAEAEAALSDLAAAIAPDHAEPEQSSLLLDEIDEQQALFAGPVHHVAKTIANARAGRGRPKGSQNKASRQFAETLMRMGYRHPGLNLAALANADPVQLAAQLTVKVKDPDTNVITTHHCHPSEAMSMILKANAELLPYFESKRPTQIQVDERIMGVMMIGEMKVEPPSDGRFMSLTKVDKPE